MTAAPALTFTLNRPRMRAAVSAFVRSRAPAVVTEAVQALAFSVGAYLSTALRNRSDTGRNQAAWNLAIERTTGRSVGPTAAALPGDAEARWEGRGIARSVAVINHVPYSPYVELGTPEVPAGLHVARGVLVAGKGARKAVAGHLRDAWGR